MADSPFTNEDLETISRTWNSNKYTEHTAMVLAKELLQARAALSHAAGQDGEQCRAASGEPDAWLYEYEHDGESDHCLSRVRFLPSWVEAKRATENPLYLRALSRGVPEGDDSLPRPLWPVSKEWYRLCERRFAVDRITISGKLAEAIVDAVCGPAIAAQRKEG